MIRSKWILGFAGQPRTYSDGEWYDTFIGGLAIYPETLNISVPCCPLCGAKRFLVLQAFAPHISHSERTIYLFGCNSIKCSSDQQSWFAMRLCKESNTLAADNERAQGCGGTHGQLDPASSDGDEVINWDTDSGSGDSTSSDLVADLAALSLQLQQTKQGTEVHDSALNETETSDSTKKPDCSHSPSLAHNIGNDISIPDFEASQTRNTLHLDSYHVEVEEEPERTKPMVDDKKVSRLLRQYEKEERSRSMSDKKETWETEVEEEELAASKYFDAFQTRISRAPEQVLRYCFGREPIWPKYPPPDVETTTNCECGSPLVFEVQILGSCLHYLQPDKLVDPQRKEAGMNFAAVAIYSCQADCTKSEILAHCPCFKLLRQTVVVQQDEW